jgi:hypothetical protein
VKHWSNETGMKTRTAPFPSLAAVLPALVATGGALWSCAAEFELECPEGSTQVAGGGDVNDACQPIAGAAGAAGDASANAGAGGGPAPQGGSAGGDATAGAPGNGAGQGGGGSGGAPAVATAFARFAHLSPDAPAFDVCLSASGAFDEAPVLKTAGLASGLTYQQVSAYVPVKAGRTLVRLVAAGAADCSKGLEGVTDATIEKIDEGTYSTVGAMGKVKPTTGQARFAIFPYEDLAPAENSSGVFNHRMINALVDIVKATTTAFLGRWPLPEDAGNMFFGGTSSGKPNNKGYIEQVDSRRVTNPLGYYVDSSTVRTTAGISFMIAQAPMGESEGPATKSLTTAFFVGAVKESVRSDDILFCDDLSSVAPNALLTSCSLVATRYGFELKRIGFADSTGVGFADSRALGLGRVPSSREVRPTFGFWLWQPQSE